MKPRHLAALLTGLCLMSASSPAFAAKEELPSYWPIVIFGVIFFWGFLGLLWFFNKKIYPSWEARIIERQRLRREQRSRYRDSVDGS